MVAACRVLLAIAVSIALTTPALAQAPVECRLSFPAPKHRWMQVEVTFADVPDGTREVRMSRTSPGRYALHEFVHAWNVERIRPRSLEPFDFEDASLPDELWFGEGFTSEAVSATITIAEDPRIEIVTLESTGGTSSPEQQRFRQLWLGSGQ